MTNKSDFTGVGIEHYRNYVLSIYMLALFNSKLAYYPHFRKKYTRIIPAFWLNLTRGMLWQHCSWSTTARIKTTYPLRYSPSKYFHHQKCSNVSYKLLKPYVIWKNILKIGKNIILLHFRCKQCRLCSAHGVEPCWFCSAHWTKICFQRPKMVKILYLQIFKKYLFKTHIF